MSIHIDDLRRGDQLHERAADDIEALEAKNDRLEAEIEALKSVPMKYRRMAFNAQLQAKNDRLEAEIESLREAAQLALQALGRSIQHCSGETYENVLEAMSELEEVTALGVKL